MFSIKKWVWATIGGWFMGVVLLIFLSSVLDAVGVENLQFYVGLGVATGVGSMQWLVLRKNLPQAAKWIWNSILGIGATFLLFDVIKLAGGFALKEYYIIVCVCLGGLVTSVLQYNHLKKYYHNARRWIIACTLGWVLAALTVFGIDYTKYFDNNLLEFILNLLLILGGGPILGIITGRSLNKIIKLQRP